MKIEHHFSTSTYPQGNGQAIISNRTILAALKKRLETSNNPLGKSNYFHSATKERSFSLTYRSKAVVLVEVREPTLQILGYHDSSNQQVLSMKTTLLKEQREIAVIQVEAY